MAVTPDQLAILNIVTRVAASLSLLCAIGTILTYILWPRFRNSAAELVVFMAAAEIISMSAYAVGRAGSDAGSGSALCQWQGIFEQIGDLSTIFWTSCIAIDLSLIMFFRWSIARAARLHCRHYMVFCTVVPLLMALAPLGVHDTQGGPFYSAGDLWCWINPAFPQARLFLFYVPLWTVFIFNLVIYVAVGRFIWKRAKYLNSFYDNTGTQYKLRFAKHVSFYLLAYAIARTPATVNRIYSMVHPDPDEALFPLQLLHGIFTPSTGVFNFAVYAYIGWIDRMGHEPTDSELQDPGTPGGVFPGCDMDDRDARYDAASSSAKSESSEGQPAVSQRISAVRGWLDARPPFTADSAMASPSHYQPDRPVPSPTTNTTTTTFDDEAPEPFPSISSTAVAALPIVPLPPSRSYQTNTRTSTRSRAGTGYSSSDCYYRSPPIQDDDSFEEEEDDDEMGDEMGDGRRLESGDPTNLRLSELERARLDYDPDYDTLVASPLAARADIPDHGSFDLLPPSRSPVL